MIGLLLIFTSTFLTEVQDSIGKKSVKAGVESIYTMGFLSLLWGFLFFLFSILFIKKEFLFSVSSLPVFLPRAVLEVILAHISVRAITTADRSTFSLVRIGTIPLLLAVDLMLGYRIGKTELLGLFAIISALLLMFRSRSISKKGIRLVIASAILAVATLSLFKYDITHFNSVEAEGFLINGILLLYFFFMARTVAKENPLARLSEPRLLLQSLVAGLGGILANFAYLYASASVMTAATRAFSVLWAILSGNVYFKEKHAAAKFATFCFIAVGLVLLAAA